MSLLLVCNSLNKDLNKVVDSDKLTLFCLYLKEVLRYYVIA